MTVWTVWGLWWAPEPDGQEDRTEAVAASDDKCDEEVDDYLDAVEDCLGAAKTLDAAKKCSDTEP
jgi:hypothetical protein